MIWGIFPLNICFDESSFVTLDSFVFTNKILYLELITLGRKKSDTLRFPYLVSAKAYGNAELNLPLL
ncbi:hypothetical protein AYB33_07580 [Leptospira santarosai]|nr:hypothetical protein AYB33_07580 [Leptospira santarosai]